MDPTKSNSPSVIGIMDSVAENISIGGDQQFLIHRVPSSQVDFELHVKLGSCDILSQTRRQLRSVTSFFSD